MYGYRMYVDVLDDWNYPTVKLQCVVFCYGPVARQTPVSQHLGGEAGGPGAQSRSSLLT